MLKNLRNKIAVVCGTFLIGISNLAYAEHITSLRCYYRVDPTSKINSEVTYTWALAPNSNNYYKLYGEWWSINLAMANMFYTDTSNKELIDICNKTLTSQGIHAPLTMYAAADTRYSYNYLIWNVDSKSDSTTGNINRIVSFGDSLSDTNNFFNGRGWLETSGKKSYYAGRFSNEKNWLDYVSGHLNLPVYNWAIGGAGTVDTTHSGVVKINGVKSQVDSWVTYMDTDYMGESPNSNRHYNPRNTLFTVLIGGNDLLEYGTPLDMMIDQERQALVKLINHGAKNILLSNLPDLSRAPVFSLRQLNQNDPKSDPKQIKEQVIKFNAALDDLAKELQATYKDSVNLHVFDAYALVNRLLENPTKYGVTNTTDSCLEVTSETLNTYRDEGTMRQSCYGAVNKADSFMYWDSIHPTTKTHKILADGVACFIKDKYPLVLNEDALYEC